ncbi:MAG: hypothetical protein J3Q66DRAFT_406465 [Benniella sp.]|nr:MAG: hypothetical protein J3Q66DRAFT_406465 [Benniella sp.]
MNMHKDSVYTAAFDDNDREISSASATATGTHQNGTQGQEILAWNLIQGRSGSSSLAMSTTDACHIDHLLLGSDLTYVASLPNGSGSEASVSQGAHAVPISQISGSQATFSPAAHAVPFPRTLGGQTTFSQARHGVSFPQAPSAQTTFSQAAQEVSFLQAPGSQITFPQSVHAVRFPQASGSRTTFSQAAHGVSFSQVPGSQTAFSQAVHGVSFPQAPGDQTAFPRAAHGTPFSQLPGGQTTFSQAAHAAPFPQIPGNQAAFSQAAYGVPFPQVPSGQTTFPQATQVSDTTSSIRTRRLLSRSSPGQEIQSLVIQATSMANFMKATLAGDTDTTYVFSPPPQLSPAIQTAGHGHAEQRTISWTIRTDAPRSPNRRYSKDEKTTIRCLVENELSYSGIERMTGSPKATTSRFCGQSSQVQMVKIESRKQLDTYFFDLTIRCVP